MLGVSKQHIQQYNYFHLYFAEYKKVEKCVLIV